MFFSFQVWRCHSREKKMHFVCRVYSNTDEQDCIACICEWICWRCPHCNADLNMAQQVQWGSWTGQSKKISTSDLTGALSQALHILKIVHQIKILLNFSDKFWWINLILLKINHVYFHLLRLCSYSDIYISEDIKFFKMGCFKKFHLLRLCSYSDIYISEDIKFFKTPCTSQRISNFLKWGVLKNFIC